MPPRMDVGAGASHCIRASIFARHAPVLATDYLVQGVAVPPGTHEIRLVYRDDDIARGMAAGMIMWLLLLASIGVAMFRERR